MLIRHHRIDRATEYSPARLSVGAVGLDYFAPSATEDYQGYSVAWYGARELLTFDGGQDGPGTALPTSVGNHRAAAVLGRYGATEAAEFYAPLTRAAAAETIARDQDTAAADQDHRGRRATGASDTEHQAAEADQDDTAARWPGRFNAICGTRYGAVFPVTVVGPDTAPRELFAPVVAVSAWLKLFAPRWCLVPNVIAASVGKIVFVMVPKIPPLYIPK